MKKIYVIITTILLVVGPSNAQKKELIGNWLATQVETQGAIENPYLLFDYTKDGKMILMGMEIARWHYNKKTNEIVMTSEFDKDFNGNAKILILTKNQLIVEKDGTKITYQKLNLEKVAMANKKSGLIGEWEFENNENPDITSRITFKSPDGYVIIQKKEYMETKLKGTWIFNPKKMTLIMIGLRDETLPIRESKVIQLNENNFELENYNKTFKAHKIVEMTTKEESTVEREHLTFYYEDFFTENGDEKYAADKEKLPWNNWKIMKKDLLNVHQLVYSYEFNNDANAVFETEILTTDVIANLEYEGFIIENIFSSYDTSGNPEPGPNTDANHPLYPLQEYMYRIVGNEQITTPAGTFDCTIIEVSNDYDMNKKLWMISDKIGIYAKIIDENTSEIHPYYHLYTLQKIIYKD
ncbi:hypothetical protein [Winogradskyella helgolandensis]|uniref:hypothetical protein n=1 Tax=Winogradskyella helgolandensis TaxID=2697010 RepID=UPI0015CBCE8C|nr:hypothetical protein [Winogradskyella helgolandensis]